ncbi:helix-turn-helix domain-containing protein [Pseudoflavitalea rhizosphaerae]|uniref:helix-turn-helix domain-containing protein n=1 Tax=Pseudoflavitalea rhizosphaerae TaxID=1884793 RepID=UPI000F8F0092|nr:AraC family transcriptional regulator [Pseudoflavitalea rhizosphaerae]
MGIHVMTIPPSAGKLNVRNKFPVNIVACQEQKELLLKLNECKSALFHNKKNDVKHLATLMHMSRATLYRKLKGVTGLTPNEWINEARMEKAAELLAEGRYRAFQVARMLGYTTQSSFGKMFLKQYKVTPGNYQRMEMVLNQSHIPSLKTTPAQ